MIQASTYVRYVEKCGGHYLECKHGNVDEVKCSS